MFEMQPCFLKEACFYVSFISGLGGDENRPNGLDAAQALPCAAFLLNQKFTFCYRAFKKGGATCMGKDLVS
jgi:hypothetical protein